MYFYDIEKLMSSFWAAKGCKIIEPFEDVNIGAATYHPEGTFFPCLKQESSKIAFLQQCNRPDDGSSNGFIDKSRSNIFFQYQVLITPFDSIETDPLDLIKQSLNYIYPNFCKENIIDIYEDNWKSPSIGAFGIGYEVRANGIEIAQVTYIQKMGGYKLNVDSLEITYGLDRITMILQGINDIKEIEASEGILLSDTTKEIHLILDKPMKETLDSFEFKTSISKDSSDQDIKDEYVKLLKMIHIFNCVLEEHDINHFDRDITMDKFMKLTNDISDGIAREFVKNIDIIKKSRIQFKEPKPGNIKFIDVDISSLIKYKNINISCIKKICSDTFKNSLTLDNILKIPVQKELIVNDEVINKCLCAIKHNLDRYEYLREQDFNKFKYFKLVKHAPNTIAQFLYLSGIDPYEKEFKDIDIVYKIMILISNGRLSSEYGTDTILYELFENYMLRKTTNISKNPIQGSLCKMLIEFDNIEKYGYFKSKFYLNTVNKIVNYINGIITTFNISNNNNNNNEFILKIDNIINNIDKFIVLKKEQKDRLIKDILFKFCNSNIGNKEVGKIVYNMIIDENNMCSKIYIAHLLLSKNKFTVGYELLYDIYSFHLLSKRLMPKVIELNMLDSLNIKFDINKVLNTKELESFKDLTKPLTHFSIEEKARLISFGKLYRFVESELNLKKVLPDLIRVIKAKNK